MAVGVVEIQLHSGVDSLISREDAPELRGNAGKKRGHLRELDRFDGSAPTNSLESVAGELALTRESRI